MASTITVSGPSEYAEVRAAVEEELQLFNAWFSSPQSAGGLGNAPMLSLELDLLRTYLAAHLLGKFSAPTDLGTSQFGDDIDRLMG